MEMSQVPRDTGLHDPMAAAPGGLISLEHLVKPLALWPLSPREPPKSLPGLWMVQLSRNLTVSTGRQQASSHSPNAVSSPTGRPALWAELEASPWLWGALRTRCARILLPFGEVGVAGCVALRATYGLYCTPFSVLFVFTALGTCRQHSLLTGWALGQAPGADLCRPLIWLCPLAHMLHGAQG